MTDRGRDDAALTGRSLHLHPLSVPYRLVELGVGLVVAVLFVGGPAFGALAGLLGVTIAVVLAAVTVVAAVGYGIAYYRRFEYVLGTDTFDIHSGVFARRDREIPLRRIQNVDISQNVVQRVLGIAELRLETAGASGSEAHLKFVGEDRARALQREISQLRRSGDADADEAEPDAETVFEITMRELGLLALVSADAQFLSVLFLGGSILFPAASAVIDSEWFFFGVEGVSALVGPLVTLVGILLLGLGYGVINATVYYGFTLRRTPEELRYERGLLQRYSGTIPLSKVQSLTIEENVLARALGYASLEIETAGQSAGQGEGGTSQSAIPLAKRDRVLDLTNTIEPVGEMTFERPPKRARERYAVRYAIAVLLVAGAFFLLQSVVGPFSYWYTPLLALIGVPVAAHLKWKHRGYYVGDDHVVTRNGFWVRQLKIVPYYRVQTVLSSETIFQRRRRLGTVTIDTAGTRSIVDEDAAAVDIDRDSTEILREQVAEKLSESLRRRRRLGDPRDSAVASPLRDVDGD
ncbi:MAG: PH domain-containing protein [Halolamina sp.]